MIALRVQRTAMSKRQRHQAVFSAAGVVAFLGWTVAGSMWPSMWTQRSADSTRWLKAELVSFNLATGLGLVRSCRSDEPDMTTFMRDVCAMLALAHVREAARGPAMGRSEAHHRWHHIINAAALVGYALAGQRLLTM